MTATVIANTHAGSTHVGASDAASQQVSAGGGSRTAGGAALHALRAHGNVDRASVATLLVTFRKQQEWDEIIGELQSDHRFGNGFVQAALAEVQKRDTSHSKQELPSPKASGGDLAFGSQEHQTYGDEGARNAGYQEVTDVARLTSYLTQGDFVLLCGDYFDGRDKDETGKVIPDSLFNLLDKDPPDKATAGTAAGTNDEILFALFDAVGSTDARFAPNGVFEKLGRIFRSKIAADMTATASIRAAVKNRYWQRAAKNHEHFVEPNGPGSGGPQSGAGQSAGGSYRVLHEAAILAAYHDKQNNMPIKAAMRREAASEHYLTDAFSSGHVRTPRAAIATYWDGKYPLFFNNLKKTIAQDVAMYINAHETNVVTLGGTVLDIMGPILTSIEEQTASLPTAGIGAIVSVLAHDDDNAAGLAVENNKGERWTTFGDGQGGVKQATHQATRQHVTAAVTASVNDIQHAYALAPGLTDAEVLLQVRAQSQPIAPDAAAAASSAPSAYEAEQLMPHVDPTAAAANGTQAWQQSSFAALWQAPLRKSATFGAAIEASMQSGDLDEQVKSLADKFPDEKKAGPADSVVHPKAAYQQSFLKQVKAAPKAKIQSVIDYDPGRGQHASRRDDATLADIRLERERGKTAATGGKPGGFAASMKGLTHTQRVSYVKNLLNFEGRDTTVEAANDIVQIFIFADAAERHALYEAIEGKPWSGEIHGTDWLKTNLLPAQVKGLTALLNQKAAP